MPPHVPRRRYPPSQPTGQQEFPVSTEARWARWMWGLGMGATAGFLTSFSHEELRTWGQFGARIVVWSLAGGLVFGTFGDKGLRAVLDWWLWARLLALAAAVAAALLL